MSQESPGGPAVPAVTSHSTMGPGSADDTPAAGPPEQDGTPASSTLATRSRLPQLRPWVREVLVLVAFLAAGTAVTWPRAAYLAGRLPLNADQAEYVWNMWWVAHQVVHFGNPWSTSYLAAPAGVQLGFDTLTPLLGVVMAPVTLVFGPAAAYNLLAIVIPGLAGYAMYRAARLWLPPTGALAAGAFFGLSGAVAFQAWYHIHTAAGCVFLPLALETAVRVRRAPTAARGIVLGVVLGASMLVDQELSVITVIVAALVVIPWLLRHPSLPGLRAAAAAAVTGLVVASPQLIAMAQAVRLGHANPPAAEYVTFAGEFPSLFAPSPRLGYDGLTGIGDIYRAHTSNEALATFGLVCTVLALLGLVVSWRRRAARPLALLWLGCAVLSLGPTLYINGRQHIPLEQDWHGARVSLLMPYTWLVRVPGLASFREADRFTLLGLVGAALLAGAATEWLFRRWRPLLVAVVVLGALEAGWPGTPGAPTMPTALPALDRPIAADHSGSVVVDVPFGIRGIPRYGTPLSPFTLVLAGEDGHPRAVSYTSWVPRQTIAVISSHAFYADLVAARKGRRISPAQVAAARRDVPRLHIGWVLLWTRQWMAPHRSGHNLHYAEIRGLLAQTGFRFDYAAQGVDVYRPAGSP